jgi:hypothetical protein
MKNLLSNELSIIAGGTVYKTSSTIYILAPGDILELPHFTVEYPNTGAPSNEYLLNGNLVHCLNNNAENQDNMWSSPSDVSSSFFSKDLLTIQTDMNFLYVQANVLVPA